MNKEGLEKSVINSILIVVSIIFVITAVLLIGRTFTGNVVMDSCVKPYIFMGGNCCLDNDDNGICDKDEKPNLVNRAVNVNEECSIKDRLTCVSYKVSANSIQLKLRNDKAGIFSPIVIEFPGVGKDGCKKTFSGAVEDGFDYESIREYTFDCDFTDDYINSIIIVKGNVYERSKMNGPALMPYTIWDYEADGKINAFVE